jgi:hypothetical protein
MRMHRSVQRTHTSTARGCRIESLSERLLQTGTRGGAEPVPSSCPGDERYSRRAAVRTHTSIVRDYTHGLTKRTGRARTYQGTARHGGADRVPPLLAAGSESTRRGLAGVRPSCALGSGAGTRGRRRLGYSTRTVVGARSVFLTPRRVLGGYSRVTHGPVRGTICAGQWNGTCAALAWVLTEHKHARGTANDTEYPTALGHCRGSQGHFGCAGAHMSETAVSAESVAGSEPTKPR